MSEAENKNLVRRIYEEMWNAHDPAAAGELFTRPEGVQRFVGEFLSAFPDLAHTVEGLIAEGDQVAARFSASGTHTGPWKQYAPTGKPVRYTGVTIARIADGKIAEHHTWWDTTELIEQIGG
jgi:predicted ester cyclase